jgi:sulfate permease, SulP family
VNIRPNPRAHLRRRLRRPVGAAGRWVSSLRPERRHLRADAIAGLTSAIGCIPSGMAAAVLAGVSPIYGLYANFAGPLAGGLTTRTRLMIVNTSSAAALAAGSTLVSVPAGDRPAALFLLTVLTGTVMIAAGLMRLGRFTRFVSHSVMIGFLTGIAANIICTQLPTLTGAAAQGPVPPAKLLDVITNPTRIDAASLLTGLGTLIILVGLTRTRAAIAGPLAALVIPTVTVALAGAGSVARVADAGPIPGGLPLPHLPDLGRLSFGLVTGALAVAVIVLVQGAGVAESAANDGAAPDANRDFIAQGVGNVAAGLFRGQPVGGSVAQTALITSSGARTRWGPISTGIWMLMILVAFSGVVAKVAMPTLAAVLIFAAVGAVRTGELTAILRTGLRSRIAVVTTFAATLFLPVAAAVGIGVALSLLLQLNQEAMDLRVVRLVPDGDRRWIERPAPRTLVSGEVTVLDVYGSLFYAGSRTLRARLPDPAGSESPVVVLRLRGRISLGATFFVVIADYAQSLAAVGGRLYLSGLSHDLAERLHRTRRVEVSGPLRTFEATPQLGESTRAAYLDAEAWLIRHQS